MLLHVTRLLVNRVTKSSSILRPKRRFWTRTAKYDGPEPPNGFLFNEKPLLPGEKRKKEEWENIFVYGMGFNLFLMVFIAVYKPDTASIKPWARKEAERRLAEKERASESLADL